MREEQDTKQPPPQRDDSSATDKDRDRKRTARRDTFSDEDNPMICRGID